MGYSVWLDIVIYTGFYVNYYKKCLKFFVMELRKNDKKLVSENSWNDLLLISSIILLQLTPGLWSRMKPLLDDVDDGETVSTQHVFNFSSFNSCYTQGRYMLELNLNSATCQTILWRNILLVLGILLKKKDPKME